ncbi:MAG: type I DNA topoisomerase [Bacilli bacterium]|nr:type I DNA topoisomerase [Bacilli bacterium]
MKLVIVESPNKCQTISKYLGKGYDVQASKGHLRDLAIRGKDGLGIDIENDFAPMYIIQKDKIKTANDLIYAAKKADEVILATDPDREGEAIAWHLAQILKLDPTKTKRLEFHEITRSSITNAMQNPRTIDMNLVNSQETRRIMDRVIGFKISNLLNKMIKSKSAGRVQSATLKLICDHEDEILNFKPEEYWTLSINYNVGRKSLKADYYQYKGKNFKLTNKKDNDLVKNSIGDSLTVKSVTKSSRKVYGKPAFTTSTMQQEAYNVYKFSTAVTTRIAQQLYEGLEINGDHVGLVTYIRTDSTNLSQTYVNDSLKYIASKFGKEYVGAYKDSGKASHAQEAHEAIRPTDNSRTPEEMRKYLSPEQYKLYKLIYERALGSLMTAKVEEVTTIILDSNDVSFKTEGVRTTFDGYTRVYSSDDKKAQNLPSISEGDVYKIEAKDIANEQKFTEPPARYSEAKIVKLMEEKGIGRPSTYASTISTLKQRSYISIKAGIITPTESGMKTSFVLNKYFPNIVDTKYTADMEDKLDYISSGEVTKLQILSDFYYPFIEEFNDVKKRMYPERLKQTGETCPVCGSPLVVQTGKYGEFVSCSNFPKCKFVLKEEPKPVEYAEGVCPDCGKPLVYREGKKGKFIGCSGYPKCTYIKQEEKPQYEIKVVKPCPKCGGDMIVKKGPYSKFLGCSNYPTCTYQEKIKYKSYKK